MKRRSCLSSAAWIVRAVIAVLLVPAFALRPPGAEAVLFHEHGDDGRHFHVVSNVETERGQKEHAAWHDQEHLRLGKAPPSESDAATHDEECGSLYLVFAKNLVVRAANPHPTVCNPVPTGTASALAVALLDLGSVLPTSVLSSATGPPIPLGERTISRILLSNHSLLI